MIRLQPSSQARPAGARPGWGWCIAAGTAAGIVAGLVSVGLEMATGARLPPRVATIWSAAAAGALAGLLYGALTRTVRVPIAWLWIIALGIATIDSLCIAFLPFPAGRGPRLPIVGLIVPLRQLAALVGIGRLTTMHYPVKEIPVVTAVHYMTAVVACLLIQLWAKFSQTG